MTVFCIYLLSRHWQRTKLNKKTTKMTKTGFIVLFTKRVQVKDLEVWVPSKFMFFLNPIPRVIYGWPPYSQSGQIPQNPQNHKKIEILLHKWAAGPICPDRYGPYLSFSSGTSQEMSLSKPGKSSQIWRGSAVPTLGGF